MNLPGMYDVISKVTIRTDPRIIEARDPETGQLVTNAVGSLTPGMRREIHTVIAQPDGSSWGRISEPDAAGKSQWVCIQNINRIFLERVPYSATPSLEERVQKLEAWARGMGYKG